MRISDWSSDVCSSDLFGRKTFGTGVIAAHNALKFRKLSDHAGDEIGLRLPRRLFGHIGPASSLPVIPATAGLHEHRLSRTGTAVSMDPRLRGGDGRLANPLSPPPAAQLGHPAHLAAPTPHLFVEADMVH